MAPVFPICVAKCFEPSKEMVLVLVGYGAYDPAAIPRCFSDRDRGANLSCCVLAKKDIRRIGKPSKLHSS